MYMYVCMYMYVYIYIFYCFVLDDDNHEPANVEDENFEDENDAVDNKRTPRSDSGLETPNYIDEVRSIVSFG